MKPSADHTQRIQQELKKAGVSALGLQRFGSKYLPTIIHDDEHIEAIVYGRYRAGAGLLGFSEGSLIATNSRIIFLDHKPGYTSLDEIGYDFVSGVQMSTTGPFSEVVLHTRVGDYTIRFAKNTLAEKFSHYIELRRFEKADVVDVHEEPAIKPTQTVDAKATAFLSTHDTAVLSTVDRNGNVSGAAVYYVMKDGYFYILTKSETQKAHNIFAHHQLALTVYDPDTIETLQLQGIGEIEGSPGIKNEVFKTIFKLREYGEKKLYPPVATLHKGSYLVIRITPLNLKFTDFKTK